MPVSGYTDRLPEDVLLDTGVYYVDGVAFGATNGGTTFTPVQGIVEVPYDGRKSPREGLDRKGKLRATLSGTFIQFADEDIQNFEGGAPRGNLPAAGARSVANMGALSVAQAGALATSQGPYLAGVLFKAGQYIPNLSLEFQRGNGGTVTILFAKALCTEYTVAGQDNDVALIAATFEARLLQLSADGVVPYTITVEDPV